MCACTRVCASLQCGAVKAKQGRHTAAKVGASVMYSTCETNYYCELIKTHMCAHIVLWIAVLGLHLQGKTFTQSYTFFSTLVSAHTTLLTMQ